MGTGYNPAPNLCDLGEGLTLSGAPLSSAEWAKEPCLPTRMIVHIECKSLGSVNGSFTVINMIIHTPGAKFFLSPALPPSTLGTQCPSACGGVSEERIVGRVWHSQWARAEDKISPLISRR